MSLKRRAAAVGLGVAVAVQLGLLTEAAARNRSKARSAAAAKAPREATDRRLREGEAALTAGDLAGAERLLAESYRAHGTPLALFYLGRVALAQGRTVAAQDLLRRYLLAGEGQGGAPELRAEAERALLTPLPSGEVAVLGEPGGRVLLDGHLVALLPLPLPLLVAPGAHEVRLELPEARTAAPLLTTLTVKADRRVEVRFERATAAVMVSELPTVMLLIRLRGGPGSGEARLQQAVVERLRGERLTALPAKLPAEAGCGDGLRCPLATLAERSLAHAVLIDVEAQGPARRDAPAAPTALKPAPAALAAPTLAAATAPKPVPTTPAAPTLTAPAAPTAPKPEPDRPASQDFRFTVSLLDAQVGEVAHKVEQRCDGCTLDALAAQVASASSDAAAQGLTRRRGELDVVSEPPGALLELSGRVVGPTPYHGVRFAGSYAAVLRHPGYRELTQSVLVEEGKPARLRLKLEPVRAPGPAVPINLVQRVHFRELAPRPRWRLLLGGGLLAGGAVTAGFGAGALGIDGQCLRDAMPPAQQCEQRYQTMPLGLGLIGAGAAVSLLGVVLLAVPGPHRDFESTVTLAPCAARDPSRPPGATPAMALCAKGGGR